ncbi:interleukin-3 receptor subunit alpha [Pteronotus mesoamericanus]|uniref:interleukin-3 receptor subunit alpha n=1 Tax=Pteronotus mesoamericanus TaxID=1884717 RepID=UPI0023EA9624|nr:interleukin-3 receptor subunit alpha [Pteronotus parnellii mesoamericanus]
MALLYLTTLLATVSCALPADRELSPPIQNLRIDRGQKRLTWDVHGNISSIECFRDAHGPRTAKKNHYCTVHVIPKCQVQNYTVKVTEVNGESFSTWIQYPRPEGNPKAAAEHLKCRVHDVHFLTCSWAVGKEAPHDVQYDFYVEEVSTGKRWPCPLYTKQERGTHIQCQFDNVSQFLAKNNDENLMYHFVVNGTSKASSIPCSETIRQLSEIEELMVPKLTVNCTQSWALLRWDMASHFQPSLHYELKIQKGADPAFTENVSLPSWRLTNPGTFTATVRVRGRPWSTPQRFVCDHKNRSHLHVWMIALATLLAVGAAVVLCKKYSVPHTLFPPIPRVKDPLGDTSAHDKMVAWKASGPPPEDCPVAEVQLVKGT